MDMTDQQINFRCAELLGLLQIYEHANGDVSHWQMTPGGGGHQAAWNPLRKDGQAMMLVKRFHLHIDQRPISEGIGPHKVFPQKVKQISVQPPTFEHLVYGNIERDGECALNRAVCECVVLMGRDA